MVPDSKPDKELRIQSNGSRINVNIDRTKPYVDEIKDGKKIRTYGTPEDLKKRFGDDAKIMGLPPKEPAEDKQECSGRVVGWVGRSQAPRTLRDRTRTLGDDSPPLNHRAL